MATIRYEEEIFSKYQLSDEEISQAISDKLLSSDIYSIKTKRKSDGYYYDRKLSPVALQAMGIKVRLLPDEDDRAAGYYLTDFYLIKCVNKWDGLANPRENYARIYDKPDKITVIPLEFVECIKFSEKNTTSTYIPVKATDVKRNPVVGAAVGAVVAGVPGAVAGAAINRGVKKTNYTGGYSYNTVYLSLTIKFADSPEIVIPFSLSGNKTSLKDAYIGTSVSVQNLIDLAKEERTLIKKQKIVAETMSVGRKNVAKDKLIWYFAITIFLVILFMLIWMIT